MTRCVILVCSLLLALPASLSAAADGAPDLARRAAAVVGDLPVGFSAACGGAPVEVRGARQQRAASTLKVAFALALILRTGATARAVAGDRDMVAMIVQSDNAAANRVLNRAGGGSEGAGVAGVTRILRAVGARRTVITGAYGHGAWKLTTAHDLRLVAGALGRRAAGEHSPLPTRIRPPAARALVGLMARATYPTAFAHPGWRVAHKAGWLGGVENDMALVTAPSGRRCAVALTSDGIGQAALARLGARLMARVVAPLATRPAGSPSPNAADAATVPGADRQLRAPAAGPWVAPVAAPDHSFAAWPGAWR